jgi:UDP-3-O-[3-hydroxymyristoyl] glucosamine N-acyltransferase
MKKISLNKVREEVQLTGCSFEGNPDSCFIHARTLEQADENAIIWIKPRTANARDIITRTPAAIVVCSAGHAAVKEQVPEKGFIVTAAPKLAFIKIVQHYFNRPPAPGIHPAAHVHPEAVVSPGAYIGPFVYIGKSTVGPGTIIYGHTHIYDNVHIGQNVIIHAGVIIGADGFGYDRNENNEIEKFPHIGGVVIEDNVEVGANTCIDRGTLGNTILRKNCKIDNLVHIAHNVDVGEGAFLIANAMVGGSTVIGANAWIAPSASLMQKLHIGANSTVGMAALVMKNIPDNQTWTGVPARPLREYVALQIGLKKLL